MFNGIIDKPGRAERPGLMPRQPRFSAKPDELDDIGDAPPTLPLVLTLLSTGETVFENNQRLKIARQLVANGEQDALAYGLALARIVALHGSPAAMYLLFQNLPERSKERAYWGEALARLAPGTFEYAQAEEMRRETGERANTIFDWHPVEHGLSDAEIIVVLRHLAASADLSHGGFSHLDRLFAVVERIKTVTATREPVPAWVPVVNEIIEALPQHCKTGYSLYLGLPDAEQDDAEEIKPLDNTELAKNIVNLWADADKTTAPSIEGHSGPAHVVFKTGELDAGDDETRTQLAAFKPVMGKPLSLFDAPDPDLVGEAVLEGMPWMAPAAAHFLQALRIRRDYGDGTLSFPPCLLLGPPGLGKTHFIRRLADNLGAPLVYFDAGGRKDFFSLLGNGRAWRRAAPGMLQLTMMRRQCANPIVFVDELDKYETANHNAFDLYSTLLSLLERVSAADFQDDFLLGKVDFSRVSWIFAGNEKPAAGALLSRLTSIQLRQPTRQELPAIAPSLIKSIAEHYGADPERLPSLSNELIATLAGKASSVRQFRTLLHDALFHPRPQLIGD